MREEFLGGFAIQRIYMLKNNISYVLVFTHNRLVAVRFRSPMNALHVVKALGSVTVGTATALVHVVAHKLVREPEEIAGLSEIDGKLMLELDTPLAADKRNFAMRYSDIAGVEMRKSGIGRHTTRTGKITIFTHVRKQQFDIIMGQEFEDCVGIVRSVLPNKLNQ